MLQYRWQLYLLSLPHLHRWLQIQDSNPCNQYLNTLILAVYLDCPASLARKSELNRKCLIGHCLHLQKIHKQHPIPTLQVMGRIQYCRLWDESNTAGYGTNPILQVMGRIQFCRLWDVSNTAGYGTNPILQVMGRIQYCRLWDESNTAGYGTNHRLNI